MDLVPCVGTRACTWNLGRAVIPTGIAIELPGPETVALVFARSGLAVREGLALSNGGRH